MRHLVDTTRDAITIQPKARHAVPVVTLAFADIQWIVKAKESISEVTLGLAVAGTAMLVMVLLTLGSGKSGGYAPRAAPEFCAGVCTPGNAAAGNA